MKQFIVAFEQDELGDWVAILACDHRQHVRHNPPLVNRPWVLTAEGRQRFVGFELDCLHCDEVGTPNNTNRGNDLVHQQLWQLATAVQEHCFAAAVTAYEDARSNGLCEDGAWEGAVDAMRAVDLAVILAQLIDRQQRSSIDS